MDEVAAEPFGPEREMQDVSSCHERRLHSSLVRGRGVPVPTTMCVVNRHRFQLPCTEWVRRSGSDCDGYSWLNRERAAHKFVCSAASLDQRYGSGLSDIVRLDGWPIEQEQETAPFAGQQGVRAGTRMDRGAQEARSRILPDPKRVEAKL